MHIVRAFIGVDSFQIDHVADDMVFIVNAIATVHVTRHAGHVQGLATTVALNQADHFWHSLAFVHETPYAQAAL